MIFYDYYADIPEQTLRDFVSGQELGRLVTVGADGQPHIGLYPFLFLGESIEIHLHRADEQLADLKSGSRCAFEVDEIHGTIPSHWIHASNRCSPPPTTAPSSSNATPRFPRMPANWPRSSSGSWRITNPTAATSP
jgi:hypothetical protein